jgi:hypothetical protein
MLTSVPIPSRDDMRAPEPMADRPAPRHIDDVELRMRRLVGSVEPAIVFSSLIRLCVPLLSDACTVDIVEGGRIRYRIHFPVDAAAMVATGTYAHQLETAFQGQLHGWPSFAGVMTSRWLTRRPTAHDEARAARIVAHAVRRIRRERLEDSTRSAIDSTGSATVSTGSATVSSQNPSSNTASARTFFSNAACSDILAARQSQRRSR